MRVVSLVPSWTETLLAAGVNVVGRTRFCVHADPAIPVVGGTKDLRIEELEALGPDLVLVDKEENLPWMARSRGWKVHCTHIQGVRDVAPALDELAGLLENVKLAGWAREWRAELADPPRPRPAVVPGFLRWVKEPERPSLLPSRWLYLIWRGPWMTVSPATFVGSVFSHLGYGDRLPAFREKYPKIDLGHFDPADTLLLFSSEPYPFGKKTQELRGLGFPSALVDGEAFSWFGLRSLRFLQKSRSGS